MSHQHRPTSAAAIAEIHDLFPLVEPGRSEDRHDRGEHDRRERGERHVDPAVDDDVVPRTERPVEVQPAVQERVGEIEEVGPAGVELVGRQGIEHEGHDHHEHAHEPRPAAVVGRRAGRHDCAGLGSPVGPGASSSTGCGPIPRAPSDVIGPRTK